MDDKEEAVTMAGSRRSKAAIGHYTGVWIRDRVLGLWDKVQGGFDLLSCCSIRTPITLGSDFSRRAAGRAGQDSFLLLMFLGLVVASRGRM